MVRGKLFVQQPPDGQNLVPLCHTNSVRIVFVFLPSLTPSLTRKRPLSWIELNKTLFFNTYFTQAVFYNNLYFHWKKPPIDNVPQQIHTCLPHSYSMQRWLRECSVPFREGSDQRKRGRVGDGLENPVLVAKWTFTKLTRKFMIQPGNY